MSARPQLRAVRRRPRAGLGRRLGLALSLALSLSASACDRAEAPPAQTSSVDTRLETHAVLPGSPSAAGLAYLEAVAEAHARADAASGDAAIAILAAAAEREPVAGDGTAELVHYELLARTAEAMLANGEAERALALLAARLGPETSLPIDRAAARGLVALGDAAAQTGDLALAMGSYARALDMLTLLLEEVEP